ncbi:MAG: hypothetical protein IIA27_05235 [Gemmatimonadetes bacterium]|nr:hypothetical protein [Gemmatimonadota bacterium]
MSEPAIDRQRLSINQIVKSQLDVAADLIGLDGSEQGGEVYYEAEIVPWFHVTADLQGVDPGLSATGTTVILGLRGNVSF